MAGCALFDPGGKRENLLAEARAQGWRKAMVRAGGFDLFTLRSPGFGGGKVLAVYIEGDGRAWLSRRRVSPDPTPSRPVGLRLALGDPARNVLYLARPCQYAELSRSAQCHPRYWTSHRLAPEVIRALGGAISAAKRQSEARGVELIGFSGGGPAATLIAAGRRDVALLVTVAANLDLAAWTALHRVSPMLGSRDPARLAGAAPRGPQVHFAGADDDVVPAAIIRSYLRKVGIAPGRLVVAKGHDHDCCWHEGWARRIRWARERAAGSR